ncbi:glycerophosphoryl diester phosphodiesterase [Larkinella arboricola]|uniref:Glycerophosphoryl diester phosphodiesterase n=1 Tax=Larkinella arboricola TaxID=643671 RepID=A0A327X575_LARAB|nr:glycerophosphodiester phosphodiesterase family protein [Larkinella arboricola]RAK00243.1 glycerophosphoryl diester phosphodiesterase [Larkinella arboricola]
MRNWLTYLFPLILITVSSCRKDPVSTPDYVTKVIAHRGAWKAAGVPENSLASLRRAIQLGCSGSEFDVQMAADSVLLIHHDNSVNGIPIETTPSARLSGVKLSNGEALPTLAAFLTEGLKQTKTRLMLEIKGSRVSKERSLATARKAVELVKALKAQALVDYSSFDYEVCKHILTLDPAARVSYLNGDQPPGQLVADKFSGLSYNYAILTLKPDWIRDAKERKLAVTVWTVNDRISMQWFVDQYVDFITTDEPELLFEILK